MIVWMKIFKMFKFEIKIIFCEIKKPKMTSVVKLTILNVLDVTKLTILNVLE